MYPFTAVLPAYADILASRLKLMDERTLGKFLQVLVLLNVSALIRRSDLAVFLLMW